jgi:hypothetical protein
VGDDDQGDAEPRAVARSTSDATSGTRVACSVPLRRVRAGEVRCENFLYELKAGLRAAAYGGRPRPAPSSSLRRKGEPAMRRRITNRSASPYMRRFSTYQQERTIKLRKTKLEQETRQSEDRWYDKYTVQILGAIAAVCYAVVRISYDAFYGQLGVTTNEVGLDQATIIGRAGIALLFFALLYCIIILLPILLIRVFDVIAPKIRSRVPSRLLRQGDRNSNHSQPVGVSRPDRIWIALASAVWLVTVWLSLETPRDYNAVPRAYSLSALASWLGRSAIVITIGAILLYCVFFLRPRMRRRRNRRTWIILVLLTTTLGAITIVGEAYVIGQANAASLNFRGELEPGLLNSIFSADANCVRPHWIDKNPKGFSLSENGMVFLGSADSRVVLYNLDSLDPVRIPSSLIVMEGVDSSECKGILETTAEKLRILKELLELKQRLSETPPSTRP